MSKRNFWRREYEDWRDIMGIMWKYLVGMLGGMVILDSDGAWWAFAAFIVATYWLEWPRVKANILRRLAERRVGAPATTQEKPPGLVDVSTVNDEEDA